MLEHPLDARIGGGPELGLNDHELYHIVVTGRVVVLNLLYAFECVFQLVPTFSHLRVIVGELAEHLQCLLAGIVQLTPEVVRPEQSFENFLRLPQICEVVEHVIAAQVLMQNPVTSGITLLLGFFFVSVRAFVLRHDIFGLRLNLVTQFPRLLDIKANDEPVTGVEDIVLNVLQVLFHGI